MAENKKKDKPGRNPEWESLPLEERMLDFAKRSASIFFSLNVHAMAQGEEEITAEQFMNKLAANKDQYTGEEWDFASNLISGLINSAMGVANAAKEKFKTYLDEELKDPVYSGLTIQQMVNNYNVAEFGGGLYERMYRRAMYNAQLSMKIDELAPYIVKEIKKPQYEGKSINDLRKEATADEDKTTVTGWEIDKSSLLAQLIEAAETIQKNSKPAIIKRTDKIDFPLDKINSNVWNLLEADTDGQIEFNMAKNGSRQPVPAYYSINFDSDKLKDIQISKRLTPFDGRVYKAISAVFNAGNEIITMSQIYKHMGNKGTAGGTDLTKIRDSIIKMQGAQIFVDNKLEAKKYKGYSHFTYRGPLLPVETGEIYNVQGALTEAAIHIFREPPLMTFARQRKQITTVNLSLLQSPISKTDGNIAIDDYLIDRISKAKNGKSKSCKILFNTLYEKANITTPKQKRRTPEKVKKYLDHYKQEGFISGYTMDENSIKINWRQSA